ncbi:hypothetical protein ACFP1I_06355 [Dyadobacter subterraneus]|uniref:Coproporphyrinogen III oxidase n=1 Tax=Dyadobacter subterraneus TaxID=2773304 RepID=A0ABR9WFG4_9BACT|nr:hypothetical protein [Dyadobacter subterraneus]MBE9464249.1 hypothetical protein [Dyadobacter subterraneus]
MKTILKSISIGGLCLLLSMTACNSKKSETTSSDTASMGTTPDGNMGEAPADSTMMMDSTKSDSTKM